MVWPDIVIVSNDVIVNVFPGFAKSSIASGWNPFNFQTSEKTLHWCIIPTVPASAHALLYAIPPQLLSVFEAGVVAALIKLIDI